MEYEYFADAGLPAYSRRNSHGDCADVGQSRSTVAYLLIFLTAFDGQRVASATDLHALYLHPEIALFLADVATADQTFALIDIITTETKAKQVTACLYLSTTIAICSGFVPSMSTP